MPYRPHVRIAALLSLLACVALPAFAGVTNLRWNACRGDGGSLNRNFACDTNSGSEPLVATFVPPFAVDSVVAIEAHVNLAFAGGVLPAWWEFTAGGNCRPSSLSISLQLPALASSCVDWADGTRDALWTYTSSANTARLSVLSPFFPGPPFDLAAAQEYLAFVGIINHQKSVGTGSCSGCLIAACMGFVGVNLVRSSPKPDVFLFPYSV